MAKFKKIVGSLLVMILLTGIIPSQAFAEAAVQLQSLFIDQEFTYVDLYGLSETGLARVEKDGKYGYIDKTGQISIPLKYEYSDDFNEGFAVVEENGKYGYINNKGEEVIPCKYLEADRFFDGFARVESEKDGRKVWGYINTKGEEVIPVIYDNIYYVLSNGYTVASDYDAATQKSTSYIVNISGYSQQIDGKSPRLIKGKYVGVQNADGGYTYYDLQGNKLNFDSNKYGFISNDLMAVSKDGKYGYIDKNGTGVISYDYTEAHPFDDNGLAIVSKEKNNLYAIDKSGNTVIKPDNYRSITLFNSSNNPDNKTYYLVSKYDENGKVKSGCVDNQGNIVIPAVYESIGSHQGFANGIISVKDNGKFGFADKGGNLVIPAVYDEIHNFKNGVAAVKKDDKWGFIDAKGNTVLPFQYEDVSYDGFNDSLASVMKDGKSGVIDTAGNTVIPFEYENASDIYVTPEFVWIAKYDYSDKDRVIKKYSLYAVHQTAVPTQSTVLVDGKNVAFQAFNINGSNYFKLRDIAKVLNGTKKQFAIGWDDAANSITITTGKEYSSAGGELSLSGNTESKAAAMTDSRILLNGSELKLTAYNIDGSNYFKLRDLAEGVNFGVGWNEAANTITIDTTTGYTK